MNLLLLVLIAIFASRMTYSFAKYRKQYKSNLMLALPVVLTQLGQILTQFADNVMVGRYGGDDPIPLAAVSFGSTVFFILFIAAMGITMGLTPLVGELFAQGDRRRSSEYLQNGIIFFTALGFVVSALQLAIIPLLYRMGQPVDVVDMAIPYYKMLVYSMPAVMLFFVFKQFLEGVGNTHAEMYATIISNVANVGMNFLFIYGYCGFPEMGAEGAGLATLLARIIAMVLIVGYFLRRRRYRLYLTHFSPRSFSLRSIGRLLSIGTPISMQMFLESSAFVGIAIMMGWFGSDAVIAMSSSQIATTLGNCAFMIVVSLSAATTIRISHCYGARRIGELSLAAQASFHLVLAWNAFAALMFILLRNQIPLLFTSNAEVVELTSTLLVMTALYQLSDGLQNVSIGVLRGIQDVRIIMPISLVAYWLLNLPIGYLLGFTFGMGPAGLYLSCFFGLSVAAVLGIARIRHSIGRLSRI